MVAAVLGAVVLTRGDSPADRRAEVVRESERFAVALTSYDYRHLDDDFGRVRAMSLAGFREEYDGLLGKQGADALKASRAVSVASVAKGPFVASLSGDEARTVTVVRQKITNKDNPDSRTVSARVELYLVRTVSGWRIDRVLTS